MKRLFLFALSAFLLMSCDDNIDQDAPSVAWPSNTKFSVVEMGTGFDTSISVNAPAKIESLTLTLGLGDYALLANQYINIGANKSTSNKAPVFDVIDDSKVAEFLSGLGMTAGTGLRGKTIGTLNLEAILEAIVKDQLVANNSSFTVDIKLSDQAGKTVSKVAKFHYTAPPSIVWTDNPDDEIVDLKQYSPSKFGPSKVRITAPGKIRDLTVTLEDGGDPALAKYIRNRTTGETLKIDLINDPKAEEALGFPSSKVLSGKTDAVLDFSFIYGVIPDLGASTNVLSVKVVDNNGKPCVHQLKFKK